MRVIIRIPPGLLGNALASSYMDSGAVVLEVPDDAVTPKPHCSIVSNYCDEFELLSGYRLRWHRTVCHLSEDQNTAMRSILDGDGSFATLGELIYDDSFYKKSAFYDIAKGLRKKFKQCGIPREIRPRNQRLVILEPKK